MQMKLFYADGGKHPVIGQVYHQCQEILNGDEKTRYQRYLANTLSNFAQSIEECDRILTIVERIETGLEIKAEIEGNDVSVTVSKNNVQIDINVNDDWIGNPEGKFLLIEFKTAINAWKAFLKLPESFGSEVVVNL